jgi:transcriptional regulator with XRE-family HTH domain
VRAQRKRLKLSAEDFGKLLGVSAQTVYFWEQGRTRPRKAQFAALVAARSLGRREALARLEAIDTAKTRTASKPRKKARKKVKS